jgi:hypothetical protein
MSFDSFGVDHLLPRWRSGGFNIKILWPEDWYQAILSKFAPDGVLRKRDVQPTLNVSITIEGITKHFEVHRASLGQLEFKHDVMGFELICDDMREVSNVD